jgi:methionyl-tRNA formyltransferase
MGTPEAAVPTLRAVAGAGFPVPLVITRPDRRRGRGSGLAASPVKEAALDLELPVFQPEDVNDPESVARLAAAEADFLLVVAFGRILKRRVFETPRVCPLNLHFSLLPEYRGAAPVERAIAEGRTRTGVSLQRLVKKLDAGPVFASETVEILPDEAAGALERRLATIGADLVVRSLPAIARGEVEAEPQDESRVSFAPMLAKEDGRMDFTRDAAALARHVRAMDPWPGAQAVFAGERRKKDLRVILTAARPAGPSPDGGEPGVVAAVGDASIDVVTGDGLLAIRELKPAGKRAMSAKEFANGYHVAAGDRFLTPR